MKGERFSHQLNLNAGSLTVMFLPFQKRVGIQQQTAQLTNSESWQADLHVIIAQENTIVTQKTVPITVAKKPTTQLVTKIVENPIKKERSDQKNKTKRKKETISNC